MAERALAVGDQAPSFSLKTTAGETVTLSSLRGRRVVLYFYPKDDTPGCTKEACSFQEALPSLRGADAVVLGVSCDDVASHQRFAQKFSLTFPLLSDPDARVSKAYGVYQQKSMYGRTYWGIERTTFLIDEQGRVAQIFPQVKVDGHSEAVLQALRDIPRAVGTPATPASKGRASSRAGSIHSAQRNVFKGRKP